MPNTKKRFIITSASLIVCFILLMTWFYPYSIYSIYKIYYYKPDLVVVSQYSRDVKEFKETLAIDMEEIRAEPGEIDLTVDRAQYIIELFEQDWLLSKDAQKLKKTDLDRMLFEVKHTRNTLLSLVEQVDYSREQRQYLVSSIDSMLELEEFISRMNSNSLDSRKDLRIQFSNLRGDFMSNFMMFTSFYHASQDERLAL